MFILALDCSTAHGSIALAEGADLATAQVRWRTEFPTGRGEGGKLFTALAEAQKRATLVNNYSASATIVSKNLDQIVVGLGPGSYSGVRQAIAAATGLAAATGARLVGVPSAAALEVAAPRYQAIGDARRGAFYYTAVEGGRCVAGPELLEDQVALEARLAERVGWPLFAVESLAAGLAEDTPVALPSAERLINVPAGTHILPPLEPIYLRPVAFTLPRQKG